MSSLPEKSHLYLKYVVKCFETLKYIRNNIEMLSLETIAELYEKNELR